MSASESSLPGAGDGVPAVVSLGKDDVLWLTGGCWEGLAGSGSGLLTGLSKVEGLLGVSLFLDLSLRLLRLWVG